MSVFSEWYNEASQWVGNTWEWVKDQWDDFTDNFVYYMNNMWIWAGEVFTAVVGLIIIGSILISLGIASSIWAGLTTVGVWIAEGWTWITGWTTALYGYWSEFMDWLRWDDIKRMSDIGEIISPEYRQAVQDVYGEISKVSGQLGLGTGFMLLALSDARNLVMDTTSLMGRSYDLSEVTWIAGLTGYLEEFNEKAETFKDNPEGLILDIQAYFDKDIITTRSAFQTTMIEFMGTSIKGLTETGKKLVKLKDSLEQTILHFPAQISGPIYRKMEDDFEAFDTFMDDKFTPAINNVQAVTETLTTLTGNHDHQLGNIAGLMSNPGEMLANINELPEMERIRQESQITEIATRSYRTEAAERNQDIDNDNEEFRIIAEAMRTQRKPPSFLRLEYEGKPKPTSKPSGVFASWQVGDY